MSFIKAFLLGTCGLTLATTGMLLNSNAARADYDFFHEPLTAWNIDYPYYYDTDSPHLSRPIRVTIPSSPAYIYADGPDGSDTDLLIYADGELLHDVDTSHDNAGFGEGVSGVYTVRVYLESCPNRRKQCTVRLRHSNHSFIHPE